MNKRIFIGVLLGLICLSNLSFGQESIQTFKEYVIKSQGDAEVAVEPDSFQLVFAVESESLSLKRATAANAKKISAITDKVKALKVPNIEFSTSVFEFSQETGFMLIGKKHKIQNKVTVKAERLDYAKLSDYASGVIDTIVENEATQVGNLSFYLKDEQAAEAKVLKAALADAKAKAVLIAQDLGVTLKGPYNVIRFWFQKPSQPVLYRALSLAEDKSSGGSQVTAGKKTYMATIELEYKFQ